MIGNKTGWMKSAQEESEQNYLEYERFMDIIKEENKSPEAAVAQLFNLPVRTHWEICEHCHGEGVHDNPNLHSVGGPGIEGLAEEDPDFREEYMSGMYDVPCKTCRGTGKVKITKPLYDKVSPEVKARCEELLRDYYSGQDEMAAEAKMRARGIQF